MKNLFPKVFFVTLVLASCSKDRTDWRPQAENPEFVHRSVKQVTDIIVHDIFSPPVASRIYAYMSVAGYEAAIHHDKKFISLAGQLNGLEPFPQPEPSQDYCYSLASVQAMLKVARALVFSEDKLDAFYNKVMQEYKDTGMPDEVFDRSVAFGTAVADHVMAWSSKDNYKQSRSFPKYSIQDDPATWKPTPPAYMDAVEPHWNKIRPFVIDSASQFRPHPPTAFSIAKDSQFFKEALEVHDVGTNLSEEQRQIASFWDCNPFVMNVKGHVMFATKKISPGGHWMNITHVACAKKKANFVESAEAYVRVSLSLIDGFIICWDEKYRSRLIRPETYINQYIDENWVPLLQTPPFPEYTSGHSVISSSAAIALTSLFGDGFSFTDSTEIEFGLTSRTFNSFVEASKEAAVSRLYGGIHYNPACNNGIIQGSALGNYIAQKINTRKNDLAVNP
ncbi:MAG TPA: vanadium-dependent haloperoxidase [Chryseolinea sp.]|nr:vanadium-dependent haloperoxidase [Chryseolinea sp.]